MSVKMTRNSSITSLMLLKDKNKIGLYLLDIDLKSNITGLELTSKIRQCDPRGYIVFITTHDAIDNIKQVKNIIPKTNISVSFRFSKIMRNVLSNH